MTHACYSLFILAHFYRPRSEASEGYVFTGVCHFNSWGRRWATPKVYHLPPPHDQVTTPPSPPLTRSQHLPSHPGTRSQHPPPDTRSQHLPPPGTRSQHPPPPPGLCTSGYTSYWNAFLSFFFTGRQGSCRKVMFSIVCVYQSVHDPGRSPCKHHQCYRVPTRTGKSENLEKWEGIFQSGKNQGILNRLEKSGNITQNTGKMRKFQINII